MNDRPKTYTELRKMIREARQISVGVAFNDGQPVGYKSFNGIITGGQAETISVPVTKEYAYRLYSGLSGEFWDNGYTATWDDEHKSLCLN